VAFAPNFPALAVDRGSGPQRGTLYMVWAEYPNGAPAPSTGNIREQEPNDTPATAQVVPLDCDVLGGLGSLDFADADYFQLNLTKGETIWIGGQGFAHTCGWELHMELPDGSLRSLEGQPLKAPVEAAQVGQPKATIFTAPRTGRYFIDTFSSSLAGST